MKVILLTAPKKLEIVEVEKPRIGDDQILCKTMYTAISPGTYLQRYLGIQPGMKSYPFISGYLSVSQVVEVGTSLRNCGIKEGDILPEGSIGTAAYQSYNGADSEYVVFSRSRLPSITKLTQNPKHVAFRVGAQVGFATALDAESDPTKSALVVGQGLLGLGCTRAFALTGAYKIAVVDLYPKRLEIAKRLGATDTELGGEHVFEVLKEKHPDGFDIVVEATGNPKMMERIFELSRSGDVFLASLYSEEASVRLGDFRRRRLLGTPCRNVLPLVYRLVDVGLFMMDEIISDVIPPEEMDWGYQALLNEPEEHLGILVDWTGETKSRQRIWR